MKENFYLYSNQFDFPENIRNATNKIQQQHFFELNEAKLYNYLLINAQSEEDKKILNEMVIDKINTLTLLNAMYNQLSGRFIEFEEEIPFKQPTSFCNAIKTAITNINTAIKEYRQIQYAMQSEHYTNVLFEIITNEIANGIQLNFLYTKNKCNEALL